MSRKRTSENDLVVSSGAAAPRRSAARRGKRITVSTDATQVVTAAAPAPHPAVAAPSHEEIARLAYSYWEARGCQGGSPEEDWARAERELHTALAATA